ncbi:MAG: enoyl-CoA hydratase/isomerase family protein [Candidatus Eisenbacteria bacterium]|uniref:Enoyl-CoA hydratase/isomerase family protein n=1 Tax=Eiseniibacteriota bacterium TaxID=2212470 RepID=A0A956NAD9_UNCEI|nr:enoyl-CoA hydratase/isomerase family protein [Candidatus Eisenbacteria bacterium]MCB9463262.1 enoyl-CoA hydratase/isomerase family protein [Candidatus Eisenbacteria bacterium]
MSDLVRVEREKDLVWVVLDREEKRNALDREFVDAIHAVLATLEEDPDVGVVVFRSSFDSAFVSGADIAELRDRNALDSLARINARLFDRIEQLPMPTIAAIQGYALGGGCEFTLACDLRVAGRSAKMGQPEVGLGILPGAGGTQRLPRIIGLGRAKELVLTGRIIEAEEAERIGLVHQVVPDGELYDHTRQLADRVLANGKLATRLAKLALDSAFDGGRVGHRLESVAQAVLFDSEDKKARMTRFLDRKKTRR